MNPKTSYIRISYDIDQEMPIFPGNPENRVEPQDSFEKGAQWNTFSITLFNHNGTHVDAPNHFDRTGRKIGDYQIEELIFKNPFIVDIPKKEAESITANDLFQLENRDCDILLVRTGFYQKREQAVYVDNHPWLSPEAARSIRNDFTKLRAVGIDTVSIGSHRQPIESGEAHRILLQKGNFASDPLLLIEDLNLGLISNPIKRIFVIPLFINGVDGTPCTVFVEQE